MANEQPVSHCRVSDAFGPLRSGMQLPGRKHSEAGTTVPPATFLFTATRHEANIRQFLFSQTMQIFQADLTFLHQLSK
jgi:hypothetical protein